MAKVIPNADLKRTERVQKLQKGRKTNIFQEPTEDSKMYTNRFSY